MAYNVDQWAPSPADYMTCYLYNMLTDEKIIFKTLPESVSESYSADWQMTDIMGRSAPYAAYIGSAARTVSYSVTLMRDILGSSFKSTVERCIRLVYPKYVNGGVVAPPFCYVRFGGMISMFAIVNDVSVEWSGSIIGHTYGSTVKNKTNFDANENLYSQADISFSFTELRVDGQGLPTGDNLRRLTGKYF